MRDFRYGFGLLLQLVSSSAARDSDSGVRAIGEPDVVADSGTINMARAHGSERTSVVFISCLTDFVSSCRDNSSATCSGQGGPGRVIFKPSRERRAPNRTSS
jgi:hypothetical protein